jgi:hypothetical protein
MAKRRRKRKPSAKDAMSVASKVTFPHIALPKKRAFLVAYCQTGTVTHAAVAARVSRRTHVNWMKNDPAYALAFADAREHAGDLLEREAMRRGVEGVRRFKFSPGGKPYRHPETGEPYSELEYSDTLLIFLLKGIRPEKYRERYEHTGPNGGPIRVQPVRLDHLTEEELGQLEAADAIVKRIGDGARES